MRKAKNKSIRQLIIAATSSRKALKVGDKVKVSENEMAFKQPIYSLSKALDNSLDKLEQRMADYIARVDRILA